MCLYRLCKRVRNSPVGHFLRKNVCGGEMGIVLRVFSSICVDI